MKTSELTGAARDWAVAMAENWAGADFEVRPYSTDWSQGGPIIDREHISTAYVYWGEWEAWDDKTMPPPKYRGPTPLIAAMRCYVASKLGEDVEVPEELK
jgi:hypothetical protein